MRINWINKEQNPNLLIITLGWGASPEVIENQLFPAQYDIVILYDYRNFTYNADELKIAQYSKLILVSWSFGVWAAEQLFANQHFDQAVAIAGTPLPINREYGIDPRIFGLTLKSVLNDGVAKFVVRMCGKHLREYLKHHSQRELADIQQELTILNEKSQIQYTPTINWTNATIPGQDLIFPPRTLANYWNKNNIPIEILDDTPHYPFYDNNFILCRINH